MTSTLTLDRPHRFAVDDEVYLEGTVGPDNILTVVALTLRVDEKLGVAYPTYTLSGHTSYGPYGPDYKIYEEVSDVLCTADLLPKETVYKFGPNTGKVKS